MSINNRKLYEPIKEFLQQAINLLEDHIGKDVIELIKKKPEKDREPYYNLLNLSEPTFLKLLSKYEDAILQSRIY